jgi:hypothetical protein
MSTSTVTLCRHAGAAAAGGLLRRLLRGLLERQARYVEVHVAQLLSLRSDAELARLGLTAAEVAFLRKTGRLPRIEIS